MPIRHKGLHIGQTTIDVAFTHPRKHVLLLPGHPIGIANHERKLATVFSHEVPGFGSFNGRLRTTDVAPSVARPRTSDGESDGVGQVFGNMAFLALCWRPSKQRDEGQHGFSKVHVSKIRWDSEIENETNTDTQVVVHSVHRSV